MKHKILLALLLSILAVPYGGAMEWVEALLPNRHLIRDANEMQAQVGITLSHLDQQIGGSGAIDASERLHILTEALGKEATSLEDAVNTLTIILADIPGIDLAAKIIHLTQAREKERIAQQDLVQVMNAMQNAQAETIAQLQVLEQRLQAKEEERVEQDLVQVINIVQAEPEIKVLPPQVPEQRVPPVSQPPLPLKVPNSSSLPPRNLQPVAPVKASPKLSPYQQGLLARRHQIGDVAWEHLRGANPKLAAALSNSIQQNPGTVEILTLERNSFSLFVDGRKQRKLYKY